MNGHRIEDCSGIGNGGDLLIGAAGGTVKIGNSAISVLGTRPLEIYNSLVYFNSPVYFNNIGVYVYGATGTNRYDLTDVVTYMSQQG